MLGLSYNWLKKLSLKKWIILLAFLSVCNIGADFVTSTVGGVSVKIIERIFLTYAVWFLSEYSVM